MDWQPINTAPLDGRGIMVKGGTLSGDNAPLSKKAYEMAHVKQTALDPTMYSLRWEVQNSTYYFAWIENPEEWAPLD